MKTSSFGTPKNSADAALQTAAGKASTAVNAALGKKGAAEGIFKPLLLQLLGGMIKQTLLVTSGLLLFSA